MQMQTAFEDLPNKIAMQIWNCNANAESIWRFANFLIYESIVILRCNANAVSIWRFANVFFFILTNNYSALLLD